MIHPTRMTNNAKNMIVYGRAVTAEEMEKGYDSVTMEDIKNLAKEIFDFSKVSLSAVGKVSDVEEYKNSAK